MTGTKSPPKRFYDLDALRAVAMLLGIVLHSSVFVRPEAQPLWPVHDSTVADDPTYKLVVETIHGFRMPVFFLLSGFFSALSRNFVPEHALCGFRGSGCGFKASPHRPQQ